MFCFTFSLSVFFVEGTFLMSMVLQNAFKVTVEYHLDQNRTFEPMLVNK